MKVLLTSHVEHYTLGMAQFLAEYVNLWVLSTIRLKNFSKQLIIPNIRKVKGVLRILTLKTLPKLFDVVHANDSKSGLLTSTYDKLIVTEHGWPDPNSQHESARRYYLEEMRALLSLYEIGVPIVTISTFAARMLREKFGVKVYKVIYHGLLKCFRTKTPRTLSRRTPTILWVSRLIPSKEPNVLLDALKILNDQYKLNFRVIIRGDGPLKGMMQSKIRKFGLTNKVSFIGRVPFNALPRLYKSATILVHTSSYEPFGFCVLEAMGMALPVIVPRYGGAYEVAGSAAISFNPHDALDLAEKIFTCLQNSENYYNFSLKSLERSKLFTWSRAAMEYLEIYKKFL
ncbi:MAG: glycosyltransferase family 4 protein [Nitrososphaerota archaeon]